MEAGTYHRPSGTTSAPCSETLARAHERHEGAALMITDDASEFMNALPARGRLMGFDVGSKTIGLAVSDASGAVATPIETVRRKKFSVDVKQILALTTERGIAGLIIGLPLNMDGTEGKNCQSVRQFARNLKAHTDLPILFQDERLSTVAVTRTLLDADASRARRSDVVDKMAAAYILQSALDRFRALGDNQID